jgi:WS/DGAT/MGAT family acyltransferase
VFLKLHHAAVDGMAAAHLMKELHSATPEGDDDDREGTRTVVADRDPTNYELLARTIDSRVTQLSSVARLSARIGLRLLAAGRDRWPEIARGQWQDVISAATDLVPRKAPETRFSGPVSPHRVMEAFGMPLSRIKRIRQKVPGSTLNDIFIAVAGGAVRKYLQAKDELPEDSLVALMPISLRSDASAGGNEVAGVPVKACSDIADPIERLRRAREESAIGKSRGERMGLDLLKNLLDVLPSPAATGLWENGIVRSVNMTVSNVRGPDQAMYLAGAKAMCMYPVSIPADGAGLNFTGVSYNGVMWVSMVSCRNMIPDPGFFLQCMRDAWEELLAAADALADPHQPPASARKRGRTRRAAGAHRH